MEHIYDMIVLGGGPAGYTAALYGTRSGLDTLILERMSAGGQMALATQIDNYPGFDQGIDGYTLGEKMRAAAERFGAQTKFAEAASADLTAEPKQVKTATELLLGKTVVIATGADHRPLGLKEEAAYVGRGLSYCAACDGMFYRGKTAAVVGGGNSAAADALLLSRICKKVILIHRRDTLRASKIYQDQLKRAPNVEFRWNTIVTGIQGAPRLNQLLLQDVRTAESSTLQTDGFFISIGRAPATELFRGQLPMDPNGYLIAGENTKTPLPGVYAAGDVREKELRQIITAAADGAVAAHQAQAYLTQKDSQ